MITDPTELEVTLATLLMLVIGCLAFGALLALLGGLVCLMVGFWTYPETLLIIIPLMYLTWRYR